MSTLFISGRRALAEASELIEAHGDAAVGEAAARAAQSRSDGNVARFCHWRHIQRVVAVLSNRNVTDTVH